MTNSFQEQSGLSTKIHPGVCSYSTLALEQVIGKAGSQLDSGETSLNDQQIIRLRKEPGGIEFADGLEQDFLPFGFRRIAKFGPAAQSLNVFIAP